MTDEEAQKLRDDLDAALARIAQLESDRDGIMADIKNSVGWMAAVANSVVQAILLIGLTLRPNKEEGDREKAQAAQDYIYRVRDDLEKMMREGS